MDTEIAALHRRVVTKKPGPVSDQMIAGQVSARDPARAAGHGRSEAARVPFPCRGTVPYARPRRPPPSSEGSG
ncbi:hypothetical protein Acsp04_59690 [Actinomadura sp. NBRC 104425]|nr:hypothetical protein Acsp04_59690 [Actinomadura sp. NBRC 104425]